MQYPPGTPEGDALRDALAASTRRIQVKVEFDWNRDGNYSHPASDLSSIVNSVEDDRQVTGNLPEDVNTLTGYSSAELTLRLGGKRKWRELSAFQIFSPYYHASPIYGKRIPETPVRYSRVVHTALGDVTVRQFTGYVREFEVDTATMEVTVLASDVLHMQLAPVTLPRWARQPSRFTPDPEAASTRPIELGWVVEEAFRQARVPSGPRQHSHTVAYWSCNGSMLPSVGSIADQGAWGNRAHGIRWQNGQAFLNGRYGLAPTPSQYPPKDEQPGRYTECIAVTSRPVIFPRSYSPVDVPNERVVGISAWVNVDEADSGAFVAPSYLDNRQVWVHIQSERTWAPEISLYNNSASDEWMLSGMHLRVFADGRIRVILREPGVGDVWRWGRDTRLSQGWHYIDARVRFRTSEPPVLESAHIDDEPVTLVSQLSAARPFEPEAAPDRYPGASHLNNVVRLYTNLSVQHVQIYAVVGEDYVPYQPGQGHAPLREGHPLSSLPAGAQADLTYIPPTVRVPAWDLLSELSKAELAVLHTDEWGTIHFIPNYQMRVEQEIAFDKLQERGLVIDDDRLLGYIVNPTADQYRNIAVVSYGERWSEIGHIWSLDSWQAMPAQPGTTDLFIEASEVMAVHTDLVDNRPTYLDWDPQAPPDPDKSVGAAVRSADSSTYLQYDWSVRPYPDRQQREGFGLILWNDPAANLGQIQFTKTPADSAGSNSLSTDPYLYIHGTKYGPVSTGIAEAADAAEVEKVGPRVVELPESEWRSFGDSAQMIAESILEDTITPAPIVKDISIPADPRLQLRDVVALSASGSITGRIYAQIIGIHRTDTADSSVDRLTLRIIETPNEWRLGEEGLSELGVSTTLA